MKRMVEMGGYTPSVGGASGSYPTREDRLGKVFSLQEEQQAIDHFYKRTGQMLVDLIVDEPQLEKSLENFLLENGAMMELDILFENINAIKDIRKELGRRHKGLTH